MLKSNTNLHVIQMPIIPTYRIIRKMDDVKGSIIVMTHISADEELEIENLKDSIYKLDRGNRTFTIKPINIICFGHLDFDSDEDIDMIKKMRCLNNTEAVGLIIPAHYDYATHTCTSKLKKYEYTETFDNVKIIKYAHGYLGKPERIIIFKHNK